MNRSADSPSPLKGERAGVRGEKVREASSLERRFMGRVGERESRCRVVALSRNSVAGGDGRRK